MNPERVLYHIDNQVLDRINLGQRWHDIIDYLSSNIKRYKKRDAYIQVSEKYLINNWDRIEWKKRMTTMLVIQSMRRIKDLKWIEKNHNRFPQYGNIGMMNLIKIRDKALYNIDNIEKII